MLVYFLDLRALEKLRFARQQLIFARFSLSRIEPVPLLSVPCQETDCSRRALKSSRRPNRSRYGQEHKTAEARSDVGLGSRATCSGQIFGGFRRKVLKTREYDHFT